MALKDISWFVSRIERYPESKQHNPDLIEFVTEYKKLSRDYRKATILELNFKPMFDMVIKWNNPVYARPFYELVVLVFECSRASTVLATYTVYLEQFLQHVNHKFQDLVFRVLERVLSEGEIEVFETYSELLQNAASVLGDRSLKKATPCHKFLKHLAKHIPVGTKLVFAGPIGEMMKKFRDLNSMLSFRIYELVVAVARVSPEGLQLMIESEMLEDLFASIQGPDAHVDQLGFANSVHIYKKMVHVPHCYDFLVSSCVIPKLEERIVEYGPGTMEDKIMPTLYEFFGDLFIKKPSQIMKDAPQVVPSVLKHILEPTSREIMICTSLRFIGQVAAQADGKRYLIQNAELLEPVIKLANEMIHSGMAENKIAALDFTEALIFTKKEDQTSDLLETTEKWFQAILGSVKHLWDFANEPYPDTARCSVQVLIDETIGSRGKVLQLMAVVSTLPWGRRMITTTPGLTEWLIDRSAVCGVHASTGSGGDPEVLRAKYAIVKNMLEHEDTSQLLSPEFFEKMKTYEKQGPIYVTGEYDVALESAP